MIQVIQIRYWKAPFCFGTEQKISEETVQKRERRDCPLISTRRRRETPILHQVHHLWIQQSPSCCSWCRWSHWWCQLGTDLPHWIDLYFEVTSLPFNWWMSRTFDWSSNLLRFWPVTDLVSNSMDFRRFLIAIVLLLLMDWKKLRNLLAMSFLTWGCWLTGSTR